MKTLSTINLDNLNLIDNMCTCRNAITNFLNAQSVSRVFKVPIMTLLYTKLPITAHYYGKLTIITLLHDFFFTIFVDNNFPCRKLSIILFLRKKVVDDDFFM